MGYVLRAISTLAYSLLAVLGGCSPPVIAPMYGPPPVEHDPSIEIADFSYQPASPIRVGDTLRFTATTSQPFDGYGGEIRAVIGEEQIGPLVGHEYPIQHVWLNDHGVEGDEIAADGIWTGELEWLPEYGPQQDLPVSAHLQWADGYSTAPITAPALTVLPAEDDAL